MSLPISSQSYPPLTIPLAVPAQNSVNNVTTNDVIGNKTDTILGDSIYSMLQLLSADHKQPMDVWPTLAAGIPVVSSAANWTYGIVTEIIPAGTIATPFNIHAIVPETCSDDGVFQLALYYGAADTLFMTVRYAIVGGFFGNTFIWTRSSPLIPANSRIRAALASSDGFANQCTQSLSLAYRPT